MKDQKHSGKNAYDLLKENRSLIVKEMMRLKHCSRTDLSRITGLTQASITKIIGGLMQLGIVEENGVEKTGRGRSKILLSLKEDNLRAIGIVLSRTYFSAGVFDVSGKKLISDYISIEPNEKPQEVIDHIISIIHQYIEQTKNIIAVGVAVPGPYMRHEGCISQLTEFEGWENFNIVDALQKNISIPVFVEHDANAAALSEWWFGETRYHSLVYFTTVDGVGAGVIEKGKILLGKDGIAGEIGHMSIDIHGRPCHCAPNRRGCLEQYCSSISFERDILQELPHYPESAMNASLAEKHQVDCHDVFRLAQQGDEFAEKMTNQLVQYLAIGISNLVNIYNPEVIILNEPVSYGGDYLKEKIKEATKEQVFPAMSSRLNIRFSQLHEDPFLLGAMMVAVNRFLDNPTAMIRKANPANPSANS